MKSLLVPSLALLAAAIHGQALTLSPTSTRGYSVDDSRGQPRTLVSGALRTGFVRSFGQENGRTSFAFYAWAAEFDLSALPAGAVVASASLTLRCEPWSSPSQLSLLGYADDGNLSPSEFSLGTVTVGGARAYVFQPPAGATSLGAFAPSAEGDVRDVGSFVAAQRASGSRYVAFQFTGTGGNVTHQWAAPSLTVRYAAAPVPEPATMAVLGLGVLGFLQRRRKP